MSKLIVTDAGRVKVIVEARLLGFLNLAYQVGGMPPGPTDCSGLARAAWLKAGVDLPHNTVLMAQMLGMVKPSKANAAKLELGDLLFYAGDEGTAAAPGHVAVYVDKFAGMMLVAQATNTDRGSEVIRALKYEPIIGYGFVGHT